ncbi:helix-turn-helix domain-containing protein [Longimycelium tulufanense]|nr:helix-turn-helix domain-containing protein [Longimycelium tulufanense]
MIGCITSDNGHRTGEIAQTLDRGLAVLELLGRTPEGLSPTQVGRQLELHRSIASRLLTTLLRRGFVHRRPDGKYVLGGAVTTLAAQVPTGE